MSRGKKPTVCEILEKNLKSIYETPEARKRFKESAVDIWEDITKYSDNYIRLMHKNMPEGCLRVECSANNNLPNDVDSEIVNVSIFIDHKPGVNLKKLVRIDGWVSHTLVVEYPIILRIYRGVKNDC